MADLEGGRYIELIPPMALGDLVSRANGRGGSCGGSGGDDGGSGGGGGGGGISGDGGSGTSRGYGGGGGGGATAKKRKPSTRREVTRVKVCYGSYLPALSLWDGDITRSILVGAVLLTLHSAVICNNCHLCGSCWEDCDRK